MLIAGQLQPLPDQPEQFARETFVLPVAHPDSGIRVDFIFSTTAYEQQAIERAVAVTLGGIQVPFVTAEDLIIHQRRPDALSRRLARRQLASDAVERHAKRVDDAVFRIGERSIKIKENVAAHITSCRGPQIAASSPRTSSTSGQSAAQH